MLDELIMLETFFTSWADELEHLHDIFNLLVYSFWDSILSASRTPDGIAVSSTTFTEKNLTS